MTTETSGLPVKIRGRELSGRVYTMADKPPDVHPDLWRAAVEQGTVESSRGEYWLSHDVDLFESEEEFDRFMEHLKASRASKE
jgi:hypothetical protein